METSLEQADYHFIFPYANEFIQTLQEVTCVGEFLTLAWEFEEIKGGVQLAPKSFLIQSTMAKNECALTYRYGIEIFCSHNDIRNLQFFSPPIYNPPLSVHPLTLRTCSCSPSPTLSLPVPALECKNIREICTFNPSNWLAQLKKELKDEDLEEFYLLCSVSPKKHKFNLKFINSHKKEREEQEQIKFQNQFMTTFDKMESRSTDTDSTGVGLATFFQSRSSNLERQSQRCSSSYVKCEIEENLIDRALYPLVFTYPYEIQWTTNPISAGENIKSVPFCPLCEILKRDDVTSIKINTLEHWASKYNKQDSSRKDEKDIANFELASIIVQSIKQTATDFRESNPSYFQIENRQCPRFLIDFAIQFRCQMLLPALLQCCRELQISSPIGICYFDSTLQQIVFWAEGEIGVADYKWKNVTKEEMDEELARNPSLAKSWAPKSKTWPLYFIQPLTSSFPFHIEIPLRQLSFFPKLCTTQNQYQNPKYVELSICSKSNYVEIRSLKDEKGKEVIELLFPYHQLHKACLTNDLSDSGGEIASS